MKRRNFLKGVCASATAVAAMGVGVPAVKAVPVRVRGGVDPAGQPPAGYRVLDLTSSNAWYLKSPSLDITRDNNGVG